MLRLAIHMTSRKPNTSTTRPNSIMYGALRVLSYLIFQHILLRDDPISCASTHTTSSPTLHDQYDTEHTSSGPLATWQIQANLHVRPSYAFKDDRHLPGRRLPWLSLPNTYLLTRIPGMMTRLSWKWALFLITGPATALWSIMNILVSRCLHL